ncbi:Reverse transcriptase zinc-binding domain [Macleaya cordata]|uniref:Reverse transcriptase zinc-binding domain n=1 Tax=Macleaya cordata TaxID=56857 RepID=A0A200QUD8_MACCD|nr:Reverse transcriptase zinc-binding domain [Macleaya cordata]OVA20865.1 Reverse transcriptase zinc-binding domain [Macleaya cordata]
MSLYEAVDIQNGIGGWNLGIRRELSGEVMNWMVEIIDFLGEPPVLNNEDDERKCTFANSDKFSTKLCYEAMLGGETQNFPDKLIWMKAIPTKVSFMLWAATISALPTNENLIRRGFQLVNRCWLCKNKEETTNHIMLHCSFSYLVWGYFIKAYGLNWVSEGSMVQHLFAWKTSRGKGRGKRVWRILNYAILWALWVERNKRVFDDRESSVLEVVNNVKSLVFLWCTKEKTFEGYRFDDLVIRWDTVINM